MHNLMTDKSTHMKKNKVFVSLVVVLLCKSFTLTAGNTWGKTKEDQVYEFLVAAHKGNTDTLKAMVQRGMSVNTRNNHGDFALCCAVRGHQVEAARFLLEQRASVTDIDVTGRTSITFALQLSKGPEMLHLLLRHHPSRHTLTDSEEVKLLAAKLNGDQIITMLDDAIDDVEKQWSTVTASILTAHRIFPVPIIGEVQSFISKRQETPVERARTLQLLHALTQKSAKTDHKK